MHTYINVVLLVRLATLFITNTKIFLILIFFVRRVELHSHNFFLLLHGKSKI